MKWIKTIQTRAVENVIDSVTRFEHVTFCTQNKRATKLCYIPF
jgi:hypothetical protein